MADPHADQRLAAIMAADVAGYSRLMEADERATVATLDTYRAVFQARDAGWTVTQAENGRVALAQMASTMPDLILLDLMMPEMDGFAFLDELRKKPEYATVPVVVVTAAELTEEDHRRLNGGVEMVLQKTSYSREELLDQLRDLVHRHLNGAETPATT